MPPFGDTMRFVDRNEGGGSLGQHLRKACNPESFRRNEQEIKSAGEVINARLARLSSLTTRVDALDAETLASELASLIIHEGDEWAHHERGAGAGNTRKLIAKGFSGASGHDQKQISALSGGAAYRLLIGTKVSKAKGRLEQLSQF